MSNQVKWTLAALLAAALLLGITLALGGRPEQSTARSVTPLDAQTPGAVDADALASTALPLEHARGVLARWLRKGSLLEFRAETVTPEGGDVIHVTRPRMRIYSPRGSAWEMRGDTGRAFAPNGQAQRGDLVGNVVITLYENLLPDAPADAPPPRVVLAIELDNAHFDNDLLEMSSPDAVRAAGRQMSFAGRGMTLGYSDLHDRIENLVIERGEFLTFQRKLQDDRSGTAETDRTDDAGDAQARPAQYYQAEFERDPRIRSASLDVTMNALRVLFDFTPSEDDEAEEGKSSTSAAKANVDEAVEDVTITWGGRLTMRPFDEPPAHLATAGDAQIIMAGVAGQPVRLLDGKRGQRITADRVTYLNTAQIGELIGGPGAPVTLYAPELGELRVPHVRIDQGRGTGVLEGPGTLETSAAGAAPLSGSVPGHLSVAWAQRGDLVFYPREEDAESDAGMLALRSVTFHKDVSATHPMFALQAQHLGVSLDPPADDTQAARTIHAEENVMVRVDDEKDPFALRSDALWIEMQQAEGAAAGAPTVPGWIHAHGNVHATHGNQTLQTRALTAVLADKPDAAGKPVLLRVTARGDTRAIIQEAERTFNVSAEQVVAEKAAGRIQLLGTAGQPARIVGDDVALAAAEIMLDERDGRITAMHVPGPGTWTYRHTTQDSEGQPRAAVLTVTWADSMHYDHLAGQADFAGNVRTVVTQGQDHAELSAQTLQLELDPSAGSDVNRLTMMTARGNVVLLAETRDIAKSGSPLLTRLRVAGPLMVFENRAGDPRRGERRIEEIRFVGPGTMLFEDKRERRGGGAAAGDLVQMVGGGDTAFRWERQLLFDVLNNDLRLEEDVLMLHTPTRGARPVQLECRTLAADLEAGGGLASFAGKSGSATTPRTRVQTITALGDVFIVQEDVTIEAGAMRYTETDGHVLFAPPAGRQTRVTRDGRVFMHGNNITWSTKDREIRGGAPGVIREPARRNP